MRIFVGLSEHPGLIPCDQQSVSLFVLLPVRTTHRLPKNADFEMPIIVWSAFFTAR